MFELFIKANICNTLSCQNTFVNFTYLKLIIYKKQIFYFITIFGNSKFAIVLDLLDHQ